MRNTRRFGPATLSVTAALAALLAIVPWREAKALRLELREFRTQRILLLFDCGSVDDDAKRRTPCTKAEEGVTCGVDSVRVDRVLSQARFDEVWLLSGGGCKPEGIALGRAFRMHRMSVRVPSLARLTLSTGESSFEVGGQCVSACTLAFMGGVLRYVDDGAVLRIHSSSSNLMGANEDLVQVIATQGLRRVVDAMTTDACSDILRTMRFFQNTLLLPTRTQVREDEYFVRDEARSCTPPRWYTDADEAHDAAQMSLEGRVSIQDLLMRLERGAAKAAIAVYHAQIDRYGPRADKALTMVEARFEVGILSTNPLSTESLIAMGYVTREVIAAPQPPPSQ